MQDPAAILAAIGLTVPSWMDTARAGRFTPATVRMVNHDIFVFADSLERRRFDDDPLAHASILTDPVTAERFRPGAETRISEHGGRWFACATDSTRRLFEAAPQSFVTPRLAMVPAAP